VDYVSPAERLEGPRVVLRRYEVGDADRMFATIDADRARLRTFLPWVDLIRSAEDELTYVRSAALQWMEGKLFDFGIFAHEGGAYLGNIGAHTISWADDRAELGEGKGIMSEAVGLLEAELFRLGFHRIEIRCSDQNARSAAVPRRAGYVHEGTLREDVFERGVRRSTMVWGKLRA
jgi:ribosomal-protein-serine acetyltransferase